VESSSPRSWTITSARGSITVFDVGANLNGFLYDGFQYLRGHESGEGLLSHPARAGCAVLVPFANRIRLGKYSFGGRAYQLPLNDSSGPNAIHGLLANVRWDLSKLARDQIVFSRDFPGEPGYPFPFRAQVSYVLKDEGLEVQLSVENLGNQDMPITAGAHPYFRLDGDLSEWILYLKSRGRLLANEGKIPTGQILEEDPSGRLDDRELDHCYAIEGDVLLQNRKGLRLELKGFRYLQVYVPPRRDSVALEPMTGAPDAFNNGMGLTILGPGESLKASFKVIPLPHDD